MKEGENCRQPRPNGLVVSARKCAGPIPAKNCTSCHFHQNINIIIVVKIWHTNIIITMKTRRLARAARIRTNIITITTTNIMKKGIIITTTMKKDIIITTIMTKAE